MPPTLLALAARLALGTVPRADSLICVPVRVLLISLRPAIEWSLIGRPLIVAVAYAVPPAAMTRARPATINAGEGRNLVSMAVLRLWRGPASSGLRRSLVDWCAKCRPAGATLASLP